ncbi:MULTISPECIES: VOC family protein [unclassified Crossiella]|uniref:VOC family protein n=1 Tax=unclassified Crossiella TaxID=2620835 RepID=UPI001FFE3E0A|nr:MULTISPECIES: VOC family protein [unclassified Crossiella]MCK2237309.1 VOC family protein [Crossiella sp. S99.2]MCK2250964.1 VOC family protein [Crossiella sp. S99.1]
MITGVGMVHVWVLDQDEAYDFYVNTLGFSPHGDVQFEHMRWLSVTAPGQPDLPIALNLPLPPLMDEETVATVRGLVAAGHMCPGGFATKDVWATYRDLKAKGVEFIGEPEQHDYGIDVGLRDPFGNHWRLTQLPAE